MNEAPVQNQVYQADGLLDGEPFAARFVVRRIVTRADVDRVLGHSVVIGDLGGPPDEPLAVSIAWLQGGRLKTSAVYLDDLGELYGSWAALRPRRVR